MFAREFFCITFFMLCCNVSYTQPAGPQVTGVVYDQNGGVLGNASIKLQKDTATFNTQTNANGIFNFYNIPSGDNYSLTITCVGYESQTLTGYHILQGSLTSIIVNLKEAFTRLEQVVVVGYGKTSRMDVSSALSSVLPENFNIGVISSASQLLQGKVAGLNISQDGNPNARASVILRGPSTLNLAQQPFYVIDGIPDADINLVSPTDIASIDILKDAAATAIYGNRAANGVIQVSTRRGRGGTTELTYTGHTAIQKISNHIDVATADELRGYLAANNKSLAPMDDDGANTDWQKEVTHTALSYDHNIGFSGGAERSVYSGSLNYLNNTGIIKKSSLKQFAGRFNLEQTTLRNKLKLNFGVYGQVRSQSDIDTLVFYNVLRFLPTLNVYDVTGAFKEDLTRTQTYNPVGLIENNQFDTKIKTLLANAGLRYSLPFGIFYNLSLSYQSRTTNKNTYFNKGSLRAFGSNGLAIRSTYEDSKIVAENYFSYEDDLSKMGRVKFLLGYSWQQDDNGNGFQSSNVNFASDATSYYNLGLGQAPLGYVPNYGNVSIKTLRLISFFVRGNYDLANKFLLQVSLRRDGSSAFGAAHRWGFFPAVSAGWRIIEEPFMKPQALFNDLKLRVSYGVTGNTIGFDPLTPLLLNSSTGAYYYNGNFIASIGPVQNPNPNLRWERTSQFDIGLDAALLKNRIRFTIDLYNKATSDIIYSYQQPSSLSYAAGDLIYANAGKMTNKGVEFTLSTDPVSRRNFQWSSNFNIAHNKNKIITLSNDLYKLNYIYTGLLSGTGQSNVTTQILQAGYPVGQFYTLRYLGKNKDGVSVFQDRNGLPTTTPLSTDRTYLGSAQPVITFGWGNTFRYKKFDLNVFFRGLAGNKILNATLATLNAPSDASNHNIPKLALSESYNDFNASIYSNRYLENGSYLRLQNATLGYQLKFNGAYLHSLRFYLTGTNLLTITKYAGIDPEMNIGTITPGIDNRNYYPQTRGFLAGLVMQL